MSRNTDIVARYAGDEFVLILPETTEDSAQFLMDRIRENFSNIPFSLCDILLLPAPNFISNIDFVHTI